MGEFGHPEKIAAVGMIPKDDIFRLGENVDFPIDEMKFAKVRNYKLEQDELLFPPSESGNRRETIYDKKGAQKIHKVTAKFVEAMQRVIVARDQWKKRQRPADGTREME
ncbi:unnamed protein product [Dovyalis caffra]|uniref:Uncharacterized protein n=1 Tax=Dovyalis caffra TaxID=77055 RepID=A0AAV1QWQ7_9ROSI|nr:unnamed protein product [Dovyalis caffra]